MDYLNFRDTDKQKLSDFNLGEIRGWIIYNLYQIETKINNIISDYFKPEKKDEFKRIILNSSIVTIGAKMKILRNIESFDKNIISKIQQLSSIRNAFAHLPIYESVTVNITENDNGELINSEIDVTSQIEIMTSSGELKKQNSKQLVQEFFDLNIDIRKYLDKINNS
jgi:hypothetical protein